MLQAFLFFRGWFLIRLHTSDFTPMEHSSISGGYTDASVPTTFPNFDIDGPRIRYLPPCGIGNDGAITPAPVSAGA